MRGKHQVCGLITDFGNKDYFTGVMKGVIKRLAPTLEVIDICNEIPSYSILPACFTIEKSHRYFPDSTIFLVVVDPGVGTARKILLVEHENRFFIGPDNGVLTPILREKDKTVSVLDNEEYFLIEGHSTFEARDKMAPAAAFLALGISPKKLSTPTTDYILDNDYFPTRKNRIIEGRVVYIDKFGNIITNISREYLSDAQGDQGMSRIKINIGGVEITDYYETYGAASSGLCHGPFMLIGSHQNLEIAMNMRSAALEIKAEIGQQITVTV